MSLHEQLYQWTARQGLDASSARRLRDLSGLDDPPVDPWTWLRRGTGALAAGLIGFGVILWIAANWGEVSRLMRFALIEALFVASLAGAALRAAWRAPLGLLAFLTLGGLLAFYGQTYQTGADPWQLFAVWALLGLPIAWAARSDLMWTPWTMVVATAIGLWIQTFADHGWRIDARTLPVHAIGIAAYALLCVAMALRPGATPRSWAWRAAVLSAVVAMSAIGLGGLFARHVEGQFWLALAAIAAGLALNWRRAEVFALSAFALAFDTLIVCGVGRVVLEVMRFDLGGLFLMGLVACGVLAASVSLIMRRMRAVGVGA
ncbi:DUF2157 domain-containing protein [Roseateles chitosanitabidus]|uniref:DUF2157 domain-containing protein n=1 Tax=Roseateles chitosanitabidus TaxID=65048 RepID=UPI001470E66E|nr:DUF2157 domain-containing protein [Roseateles chitosanitabidus]